MWRARRLEKPLLVYMQKMRSMSSVGNALRRNLLTGEEVVDTTLTLGRRRPQLKADLTLMERRCAALEILLP